MSSYYNDGRGRNPQRRNPNAGRSAQNRTGRRNTKKKKKNSFGLFLLMVLLIVGVVAGCNYIKTREGDLASGKQDQLAQQEQQLQDELLSSNTIHEGVSVNGIDLAGMTKQQATEAVNASMDGADHAMTLRYKDQSFQVPLLVGSDLAAVIEEAYNVGRSGTREENLEAIEKAADKGVDFKVEEGYSLPDMTDILNSCAAALNCEPMDATVTAYNEQDGSFVFREGVTGVKVDAAATLATLESALEAGNYDADVNIVVSEVAPDMDTATLKSKFKELATFTTKTTSNSNRNTNIRLCAAGISGAVLQPGEEFSVNTLTGERTPAKGYKDATVIKNGVYIEEPGGGVCQVSSTLFNAVIRAGFEITERYNHTIPSSYVNLGEDAAIDYPNKDFKFLNNSSGPVVVVMKFNESDRKLRATVYGIPILEEGVTLDLESELTETIPIPEPRYEEDPTLLYGEEIELTSGLEGKKVTTYLITLKDGKEISRKEAYKSNYPKRTPVFAVNSLAKPEDAPAIPEEGGSVTDGGDSGFEEGGNVFEEAPGEESSGGEEDFFIPEE